MDRFAIRAFGYFLLAVLLLDGLAAVILLNLLGRDLYLWAFAAVMTGGIAVVSVITWLVTMVWRIVTTKWRRT